MNKSVRTALAAGVLLIGGASAALSATAATYEVEATSLGRIFNGGTNFTTFTDFTFTYEDFDEDELFSIDELLTFSGVSVVTEARGTVFAPQAYDTLRSAPSLANVADGSFGDRWSFGRSNGTFNQDADRWTYEVTQLTAATVPLPAGLPLLVGGLAVFGLVARKRKS